MRPSVTWVVAEGEGDRVTAVLATMRAHGVETVGRVFVNGRPAEGTDPVDVGDRLDVYPRRQCRGEGVDVLAQRDGVVLVDKPAGLPAETTRLGEDSVVSALIEHLGGGSVHAATRLDTMVSGVMVLTLGRDAARRMVEWRERGLVQRTYLALVMGAVEEPEGTWDAPLRRSRDRAGRHRAMVGGAKAKAARTRYRVLQSFDGGMLLELRPDTGRMHQLRAHAAHAGIPLLGDGLYGGQRRWASEDGTVHEVSRVMLHAVEVQLPHLQARAPLPEDLRHTCSSLGGDPASAEGLNTRGFD